MADMADVRVRENSEGRLARQRPSVLGYGLITMVASTLIAAGLMVSPRIGAGASTASVPAQAKKHLLVLSDFPKGWQAVAVQVKNANGSKTYVGPFGHLFNQQLASCTGIPLSVITASPPQATSPTFVNNDATLTVEDSVSVFPSVNSANAEYAAVASAKLPACMASVTRSVDSAVDPKGTKIGNATVTAINPAIYGKNTAGLTTTVFAAHRPNSLFGESAGVYFVKGRFAEYLAFSGFGAAIPAALARHLTSVAEKRL
jgi:hypothetical protein